MKFFRSIILFSTFYFLLSYIPAHAATLYVQSAQQVVYAGQTFVVDWFIDTQGEILNAVDLKLHFTPETLEATEASSGNSLVTLWVQQPVFSNADGTITLTGGVPAGFTGEHVPVVRTVFRAKSPGQARITMDEASQVLRNDGTGSPVQLVFQVVSFPVLDASLQPMVITSPTHPDQDDWSTTNRAVIRFEPAPGEKYSYSFSSNLDSIPDTVVDEIRPEYVYENLPDGIYYFKLNSLLNAESWQEAAVFRVQIDRTRPEILSPALVDDPAGSRSAKLLTFLSLDKTSGMLHNRIRVGTLGTWQITSQSYGRISRPFVGDTIAIEAIDRAGNTRRVILRYPGGIPLSQILLTVLVLIIGGTAFYYHRRRKKIK